jgi:hypothetical protein
MIKILNKTNDNVWNCQGLPITRARGAGVSRQTKKFLAGMIYAKRVRFF